VLTRPI